MKGVLKFDLNEPDDRAAFERCNKSADLVWMLWDLVYNSKKTLENKNESANKEYYEGIDAVYERIEELLRMYSIDIEELNK